MIRLILAALLAILVAACGSEQPSEGDATATPVPTPDATTDAPEPTDEPIASEGDDGATSSLDELIPDDLNGVAGVSIPGMDSILQGALQAQGLDAGEAEFAFVTYGSDTDAVVLNAFRIPGVNEVAMQQLAQIMSGAGTAGEFEAESETIDGKTVLSFSGGGQQAVVYFYVFDDVAFTIAGEDAGLVEDLLSELP